MQTDSKGDHGIDIAPLGSHIEIVDSLVVCFLVKELTADKVAGVATSVLVTHKVIGDGAVGISLQTALAVVVHFGDSVSGIADSHVGSSLEIGDGGGGVDIDTAPLEIGASYVVGAHLLARLVGLVVEFESLGLVEWHITTYAVKVAEVAHGLAIALVGSLLIKFNRLGGVGLDASVAQLVVETHLKQAGRDAIVGEGLEVFHRLVMVDSVELTVRHKRGLLQYLSPSACQCCRRDT